MPNIVPFSLKEVANRAGKLLVNPSLRHRKVMMPEAIPFLSKMEGIIEENPPALLRSVGFFVTIMVLGFIVITSVLTIDIVVVGSGRLVPDTPPIVLQPVGRAIIQSLKVKAGDIVTKGQVLAVLDPTFDQADVSSLRSQQHVLRTQVRRLESEIKNVPFAALDLSNLDEVLQSALYQQRQSQYASRLLTFDEDISRLTASVRTLETERDSLLQQLNVSKNVENMRAALAQTQTGSKLQYLESKNMRLRLEQEVDSAINRLIELKHSILSKQAERQSYIDDWRRQAYDELSKLRSELNRVDEGLIKANRIHDLDMVVAPDDGVVLEVARRSVGSVMHEAEPLITLVPSNAPLIADISLTSRDVGYTKPGDDVVIKIDAFPYSRHGLLRGHLRNVSQESFPSPTSSQNSDSMASLSSNGGAFHRAQIELTSTTLINMAPGARLIPGMTLSADIKVGSRSIISYFLYPFMQSIHESIREP